MVVNVPPPYSCSPDTEWYSNNYMPDLKTNRCEHAVLHHQTYQESTTFLISAIPTYHCKSVMPLLFVAKMELCDFVMDTNVQHVKLI